MTSVVGAVWSQCGEDVAWLDGEKLAKSEALETRRNPAEMSSICL